jgi:hypothetical protein
MTCHTNLPRREVWLHVATFPVHSGVRQNRVLHGCGGVMLKRAFIRMERGPAAA